jgi:hypothetical protein
MASTAMGALSAVGSHIAISGPESPLIFQALQFLSVFCDLLLGVLLREALVRKLRVLATQ